MPAFERLRRDPGLALAALALLAAAALYAPTLGYGLVNHDDPWLVRDNAILQQPSLESLRAIWFDLGSKTRIALGAEYLPVRDVSIMLDVALWGDSYAGFHATNVALYLLALILWCAALFELGVDRTLAGLAILIWAVHPTHAESVTWISERKGVLALALAGLSAYAYARFRAGKPMRWLVIAAVAAVLAVWSKALAAFAIAALAGFELALPARRVSLRRSVAGLGTIALVGALAFIPVLVTASRLEVVGDAPNPAGQGWAAMVAGVHGFYLRLGALSMPNAITYPINAVGPTVADIVLGATWLVVLVAVAVLPRIAGRTVSPALRAAALVWLIAWFPASRIVLPVRLVVAADRYMLIPTLGLALALAVLVLAIPRRSFGIALACTLVLGCALRTLDARANWRDDITLWARAVESNPVDGDAWSMYVEALSRTGDAAAAERAAAAGMQRTKSSRLTLHRALLALQRGDRVAGRAAMQQSAEGGQPIAMANLALLLLDDGQRDAALEWARRVTAGMPIYVNGHRVHGRVALAVGNAEEARQAFATAAALEPTNLENRYNLALALIALGRHAEARVELTACSANPTLAPRCRGELARLPP